MEGECGTEFSRSLFRRILKNIVFCTVKTLITQVSLFTHWPAPLRMPWNETQTECMHSYVA